MGNKGLATSFPVIDFGTQQDFWLAAVGKLFECTEQKQQAT